MTWLWHAAHVQSRSQQEVVDNIQATIRVSTNNMLLRIEKDNLVEYSMANEFISVSPQEDNWTTFWGSTPRFCALVFETYGLSGLLISGEDEEWEKLDNNDSWDFISWGNGRIVDWFASIPQNFFSMWDEASMRNLAVPYLQYKRVIDIDLASETWRRNEAKNIVRNHLDAFKNMGLLEKFLKPGVKLEDWEILKLLRPPQALSKLSEILDIPFVGPEYNPFTMATYFDVRRGVKILQSPPNNYDEQSSWEIYEWGKNLHRVDEYAPLAFKWVEGIDQSFQFIHVFSW